MKEIVELLARRPEEGARLIGLSLLRDLSRAARGLERGDADALHAVRVAARKLRVNLGAYRALLPRRAKRARRRLASLVRATNGARDLEVAMEGLAALGAATATRAWLQTRWAARHRRRARDAGREIGRVVPPLVRALRPVLGGFRADVVADAPAVFAADVTRAVDAATRALRETFHRLDRHDDAATHRARLRLKRLRYLVESCGPALTAASPFLAELARLQHELGATRDACLLAARLRREARRAPRALQIALLKLAKQAERNAAPVRAALAVPRALGAIRSRSVPAVADVVAWNTACSEHSAAR